MSDHAEKKAGRSFDRRQWVSIIPYGLNEQHPNSYKEIVDTIWENRDNLPYAFALVEKFAFPCKIPLRFSPT